MWVELALLVCLIGLLAALLPQVDPHLLKLGEKIPGPKRLPFIGNVFSLPRTGAEGLKMRTAMIEEYGHITRFWLGSHLMVIISDPRDVEAVLKSNTLIEKGMSYDNLLPWLGTGLLTSTGEKWHTRRKALTPTFHFKILEQFVDVFNRNGKILTEVIEKEADGHKFDIQPYISRFALDVICETAMGVEVNAQKDISSKYVSAVRRICQIIFGRINRPWMWSNLLFKISGQEKNQTSMLKILHGFTDKIITEKKKTISNMDHQQETGNDYLGVKEKTAFLQMLINLSLKPNSTFKSDQDIREEVDTFMFEGHDTTTSALCCILFLLGKYPDIQEKVYQEANDVLTRCNNTFAYQDLQDLKYLECVIKESLRLYPSVPAIGRKVNEDFELPSGYILPTGTNVIISLYFLHRNKDYFTDALTFNPDNFLPENTVGRHPFAYVPFSAGPRNCIGQKFALLEIKSTIAKFINSYRIEYGGPETEVIPNPTLILQSLNGYNLKIFKR